MSDTFEFDDRNHAERFVGTLHDPQATAGDVLTVQADKSIAAQPGGGGGSGVQVVSVPVSSAQILDLLNTRVVLIPGVAGKVTVVNSAAFTYLAGLIPYLDAGGGAQVGIPGSMGLWAGLWAGVTGAGFWDQSTSQLYPQAFGVGSVVVPLSDCDGADVVLTATPAAPTLGDGTLLVTLSYFLAPTV